MNLLKKLILSLFSRDNLIKALLTHNLVKPDGFLEPLPWQLSVALNPIVTVDSCAIRYNKETGLLEASAIVRNTGIYKGFFCAVGGKVGLYKSVEEAVRGHWNSDLMGCELEYFDWEHPFCVHQHRPPSIETGDVGAFLPEPTKHSFSPFYVVRTKSDPKGYGSTKHGGQEASGYQWFDKTNLPGPDKFAYGFWAHYNKVVNDPKLLEFLIDESNK